MFSKNDKIFNFDDIGCLLDIFFFNMSKNLNLYKSLLVEFSFISDNFQSKILFFLMVKNFNNLSITSFAHFLQYLITIGNMVMRFINILIS